MSAAWPSLAFAGLRHLPTSLLSAGYAASEPEENKLVWLTAAESILSGDSSFLSRDARSTFARPRRPLVPRGRLLHLRWGITQASHATMRRPRFAIGRRPGRGP